MDKTVGTSSGEEVRLRSAASYLSRNLVGKCGVCMYICTFSWHVDNPLEGARVRVHAALHVPLHRLYAVPSTRPSGDGRVVLRLGTHPLLGTLGDVFLGQVGLCGSCRASWSHAISRREICGLLEKPTPRPSAVTDLKSWLGFSGLHQRRTERIRYC